MCARRCVSPSMFSLSLLLAVAVASPARAAEPDAFAKPEAAVQHYAKAVAAGDLDGAMEAFAIDDVAARYDFAAQARFLPAMNPTSMYAPSSHKMYVQMNKLRVTAEHAQATRMFVYSLLTELQLDQVPLKSASDDDIAAFLKAVDPARLKPLKVARVDQPSKSAMSKPQAIALHKKHAALFGADDVTERIALFQLDGQHFWAGFQLIKYGKSWKIHELRSNFAGPLPGGGPAARTTPAEYAARLK
jgi:hypothetical protein